MADFSMADIAGLMGVGSGNLAQNSTSRPNNTELNMEDFLQLMIVQLTNQSIDDAMDTAGLPLLGIVPEDTQVVLAAGSGRLLPEGGGRSASAAYRNIALRLIGRETPVMHLR